MTLREDIMLQLLYTSGSSFIKCLITLEIVKILQKQMFD